MLKRYNVETTLCYDLIPALAGEDGRVLAENYIREGFRFVCDEDVKWEYISDLPLREYRDFMKRDDVLLVREDVGYESSTSFCDVGYEESLEIVKYMITGYKLYINDGRYLLEPLVNGLAYDNNICKAMLENVLTRNLGSTISDMNHEFKGINADYVVMKKLIKALCEKNCVIGGAVSYGKIGMYLDVLMNIGFDLGCLGGRLELPDDWKMAIHGNFGIVMDTVGGKKKFRMVFFPVLNR